MELENYVHTTGNELQFVLVSAIEEIRSSGTIQ